MFTRESAQSTQPLPDPQRCLECPMCGTAISAESIAGACSSCPLYHMKGGCRIDLIACPQCGYHSLPREHSLPLTEPTVQSQGHPPLPPRQRTPPHTNALPRDDGERPSDAGNSNGSPAPCSGAVRLSDVRAGTSVRLLGFNGIDDNHLGRLTAYGLLPGVNVEVLQRFPAIILGVYQAELALETKLAEGIWVLPG